MSDDPVRTDDGWQRLDPRMLLVYPVKELARFLPVLLGVFVAGTASGGAGEWWQLVGVAVPVGLGVLRYVTTSYRIAQGRVELRRGLLNRHVLSTPVDRVRTVDVTAPPVHRLLGLTSVRIGTGTASSDDDDRLDLDGLPAERARQLRHDLLLVGPAHDGPADQVPPAILELDPAWVRYAPFTSSGLVIAAGAVGLLSQVANSLGGLDVDTERLSDDAGAWSLWLAVPVGVLALLALVALFSIGGYVVTNWGFRLSHTGPTPGGAWHLRRGLLTTRETTLDDERLRGVVIGEPIGLRLAGGARASAIVTGLDRGQGSSATLVPPAPRAVVAGVAAEVVRTDAPFCAPLTGHGPRARARRYTRALVPAAALVALAVLLELTVDLPLWVPVLAALALPVAGALATDRVAALGHTLTDGFFVVRSGSLDRRREALELDGVIGWNLRSTWFQRRAGLTSLTATTAGGRQAVTAIDVPEVRAVGVALDASPDWIAPFVVTAE
ncbi:PH domain-containing protein [Nocardioides sp.]|uniref:PH domain-containing protein n=1 Tax=Nocardioides sp. TaxID=35761 RepID=UPI0025DC2BC9|nr:PH domain-containing protein [Nocardioides sp.]